MFGSEAWAHIPDEKRNALQPKSEKCIFVGYFEDVKVYRLLQPHSHDIIIRRDVKFDENLLSCMPNLASVPTLVFDDDNKDENPPPPAHVPPIAPAPILPQWVR